jgi:hypothetical protein
MRTSKPRKTSPAGNGWPERRESRAAQNSVKANVGMGSRRDEYDSDLPGELGDGMSGRNGKRKLGTTRGSPRRSRTAKASRISCRAGEIAMCLRVGRMGPTSDDGPGQNNPDRSAGPWGGVEPYSNGGTLSSLRPDTERDKPIQTTRCAKAGCQPCLSWQMPGAGFSHLRHREGTV